ncbi:hypothetical protein ACFLS1_11440 [Verrucomicrobiota bacterium]
MVLKNKRRNRKKNVNGFVLPAPFAGGVILVSTLALGYVWLNCRCESLGKELKKLEVRKTQLHDQYLTEEYKWTQIKSPDNVERELKKRNIVMNWPRRDQIVRIYDISAFNKTPVRMAGNTTRWVPGRAVMNE